MTNNYAPILITTLSRFEHFKRCVNSLKECDCSRQTDLFIALDFPLNEGHLNGYDKISSFISEITGFKSVNIIKRESNFGAFKNSADAINFVFSKYETLIFTEDDNIFSKDFLYYINKGLSTYKYNEQIFSICGYNYPIVMPKTYKDDIYIWKGYSAWGVGLWRDKFLKIDWSEEVIHSRVKIFLRNYIKILEFNKIANIYLPALLNMYIRNTIHGDVYISMYQFLNNTYSIFPIESRVVNIGNDGSGENCKALNYDIYSKQSIYNGTINYNLHTLTEQNKEIDNLLKKHFRKSIIDKLVTYSILFLINIGLYNSLRDLKEKLNG